MHVRDHHGVLPSKYAQPAVFDPFIFAHHSLNDMMHTARRRYATTIFTPLLSFLKVERLRPPRRQIT